MLYFPNKFFSWKKDVDSPFNCYWVCFGNKLFRIRLGCLPKIFRSGSNFSFSTESNNIYKYIVELKILEIRSIKVEVEKLNKIKGFSFVVDNVKI